MKTRWKIVLAVLAVAVFFLGLTLVTIRVGPANSVEAYKNTLRAQGEKLEIDEVAPAPPLADQNGRDAAQIAFSLVGSSSSHTPDAMRMISPGKAMTAWAQPDACGSDFTNSWDDFATMVSADAPAIESLHQAAQFPKLDFGINYRAVVLLPQLGPFKRSAQVLVTATTLNLHEGDSASATTNLCVLLHLIKANEDECMLISHLVRIAMTAIATGSTWDFLQATNLTDAELAALQKSWEDLNFVQSAEKAMLMERAYIPAQIEKARASSATFHSSFGYSSPSSGATPMDTIKMAIGESLWRVSWSYSQELITLQSDQLAIQALRTMQTNQSWKTHYDTMQARMSKITFTYPGQSIIEKLDIPDFREISSPVFSSYVYKTIRIEAGRHIVVTAIALKRYQLKHGSFPDNLSELCPDFLPAVPLDPIDGNPLRYRRNDDGTYLLYSIGADGVDDGGDPSYGGPGKPANIYWQNDRARDWVWPQPATAAEIQKYRSDPAP